MRIAKWLKYSAQSFRHESKSGYNPIGNYQPFFALVMAAIGWWGHLDTDRGQERREGKQLKFGSMMAGERRKLVAGERRRVLLVWSPLL
jgi:hypothetical protein